MLCNPWLRDQCNKCSRAMGYCINPSIKSVAWQGGEEKEKKKEGEGWRKREEERRESYYDLGFIFSYISLTRRFFCF